MWKKSTDSTNEPVKLPIVWPPPVMLKWKGRALWLPNPYYLSLFLSPLPSGFLVPSLSVSLANLRSPCVGKFDKVYVVRAEQGAFCSHVSISTSGSWTSIEKGLPAGVSGWLLPVTFGIKT